MILPAGVGGHGAGAEGEAELTTIAGCPASVMICLSCLGLARSLER
jgi:hypothetical protein